MLAVTIWGGPTFEQPDYDGSVHNRDPTDNLVWPEIAMQGLNWRKEGLLSEALRQLESREVG
jgi:hypothetical protein